MAALLAGLTQPATFITYNTSSLSSFLFGGRAGLRPVTFRGAPFFVQSTDNEFGRRTVVHEFPQYDGGAYVEDLGRKARRFMLDGFVVGDDWEAQRNAVIIACEAPGSGTLVHPEFGELTVYCDNCAVTESKTGRYRYAQLTLGFIETGQNQLVKLTTVSPLLKILRDLKRLLGVIRDAATAAYVLAHLPGYIKSYVETITGLHVNAVTRIRNTAVKRALRTWRQVDTEAPAAAVPALQALVSAVTADLTDLNLVERSGGVTPLKPGSTAVVEAAGAFTSAVAVNANRTVITAYEALAVLGATLALPRPEIAATTPNKTVLRTTARMVDLLCKATAATEAVRAACFIDYQSRREAEAVWRQVLGYLDEPIGLAAADGHDAVRDELLGLQALLAADIQDRAPTLGRSVFIDVPHALPALVLAYREYGDTGRERELVARNRVAHPGFVRGRVELIR